MTTMTKLTGGEADMKEDPKVAEQLLLMQDRNFKVMSVGVLLLLLVIIGVLVIGSAAIGFFIGNGACLGALP